MAAKERRAAIPYKAAVRWLWENDDTTFLDTSAVIPSVTCSLVADIYGRTTDEVIADLRKLTRRE